MVEMSYMSVTVVLRVRSGINCPPYTQSCLLIQSGPKVLIGIYNILLCAVCSLLQHTAIIDRRHSPNQAPEFPDFSTSDHSEEDQPNSMQAAPVSTSLLRAVSSILQRSKHFGVSDTGTSELFRILHKSFTLLMEVIIQS